MFEDFELYRTMELADFFSTPMKAEAGSSFYYENLALTCWDVLWKGQRTDDAGVPDASPLDKLEI